MATKISPQLPKRFNKIALIGESPGKNELVEGLPFVGASGEKILNPILNASGIDRYSCLIDNLVRYRPENDVFEHFEKKHPEIVEEGIKEMRELIDEYEPNVIVALGAKPLHYLTGFTDAISNYRGSILSSIGFKKTYKVIPTFHPAYIIRNYNDSVLSYFDFRRIAEEAKTPEINLPQRTLVVNPTFEEVIAFFDFLETQDVIAHDIETLRNGHISCFGYATSSDYAMCIPIVGEVGPVWTIAQEAEIWRRNSIILTSPKLQKIVHNYMFEGYMWAYYYGIEMKNVYDTLVASHVMYPELSHSLAFMTSIMTREPYYKDDGKNPDKRTREDWTGYYLYNCKDNAVTYEIAEQTKAKIAEKGLQEVFDEEMKNAIYAVRMALDGFKVDTKFMGEQLVENEKLRKQKKKELSELVGREINPGSTTQLKKLLYEDMALPKQWKRNQKGQLVVTTDADALNELGFKFDRPELQLILDYRKFQTNKSFYNYLLDPRDGRAKCNYNPATQETARWSTSKLTNGIGRNFQNLPKPMRRQIIADIGYLLLEIDLEQVESRFVAHYAECDRQIQIFRNHEDIHAITAAYVFNRPIEEVSEKDCIERYLGKTLNHASNYGIGGAKYVKKLYKDTLKYRETPIKLTPKEGTELIEGYHSLYPEIRKVFHTWVMEEIKAKLPNGGISRTLKNAFGRERHFWGRLNDVSTLHEACAYCPQSGTAMIINKVINAINDNLYDKDVRTLMHTHDGVLVQIPKIDCDWYIKEIYSYFNIPIWIKHYEVVMPAEISVGERWGKMDKYTI